MLVANVGYENESNEQANAAQDSVETHHNHDCLSDLWITLETLINRSPVIVTTEHEHCVHLFPRRFAPLLSRCHHFSVSFSLLFSSLCISEGVKEKRIFFMLR